LSTALTVEYSPSEPYLTYRADCFAALPSDDMATGFMDLPAELRNRIYFLCKPRLIRASCPERGDASSITD
jgi:hypothetical protein